MPDPHNHSNFWSGFMLGAVAGVAGVYFFGTKNGRKNLQKALDLTHNLEESIEKTLGGVGEDYIEGLARSASSLRPSSGQAGQAEEGSVVKEK